MEDETGEQIIKEVEYKFEVTEIKLTEVQRPEKGIKIVQGNNVISSNSPDKAARIEKILFH